MCCWGSFNKAVKYTTSVDTCSQTCEHCPAAGLGLSDLCTKDIYITAGYSFTSTVNKYRESLIKEMFEVVTFLIYHFNKTII